MRIYINQFNPFGAMGEFPCGPANYVMEKAIK